MDYTRDYQDIPARQQLETRAIAGANTEGAEFNFWFSKWQGDGMKYNKGLDKAHYRCSVDKDAGRTRARKGDPFCIHFCHGKCVYGKECQFLHRLPLDTDEFETAYDVFGRTKYRTEREDMGGNGSFETRNRCLYVGGIDINDQMEVL
jgi:hypothetical protein